MKVEIYFVKFFSN